MISNRPEDVATRRPLLTGSTGRNACVVLCLLIGVVQLSEFLIGYEIGSVDMTFYWNIFRRHFFTENLGLWFDDCGNGLSLVANPLYGLFYFVNGLHKFVSYDAGIRLVHLVHYPLFGLGFWLWGRSLGRSAYAILVAAGLFCASGVVLSLAHRGLPFLFPIVWLPFASHFTLQFVAAGNNVKRKCLYAAASGIAVGTAYMAGDIQAIGYGFFAVVSSIWYGIHFTTHLTRHSRKDLILFAVISLACLFAVAGFSLYHSLQALQVSDRSHGLNASEVLKFSFHPMRSIEFFWSQYFGVPGTAGFTGAAYTSSLIEGQNIWWYPSVYFGPIALPVLLFSLWIGISKKELRGYLLVAALLVFWSTGVWNPVVRWLVDHLTLLRVVRYPAKTLFPACFLMFPMMTKVLEELQIQVGRIVKPHHRSWCSFCLALFLLAPPIFQETPFQILPLKIRNTPDLLKGLSTDGQDNDRVVTDIYAPVQDLSLVNANLIKRGPMYWGVKSFYCPDATITEAYHGVALSDFSTSEARENFGVTDLVITQAFPQSIQDAVMRGEFIDVAQDPADGTLRLRTRTPPLRSQILVEWQSISSAGNVPDLDIAKRLGAPSFAPGHAYINRSKVLDETGALSSTDGRAETWTPRISAACNQSIKGSFRGDLGRAQLESSALCPAFAAINAKFTPGWRATIDGKPTWIAQLNELMIAVPVPAGQHHIEVEFRPKFYRGFVEISLILQSLMFGFALVEAKRIRIADES